MNLSNNQIDLIPADLSKLSCLKILNVCNNILGRIPRFLLKHTSIERLDLRGNPFFSPDELRSIHETNANNLRDIIKSQDRPNNQSNECKLILLGHQVRFNFQIFNSIKLN